LYFCLGVPAVFVCRLPCSYQHLCIEHTRNFYRHYQPTTTIPTATATTAQTAQTTTKTNETQPTEQTTATS
jgi:hypothetical protein